MLTLTHNETEALQAVVRYLYRDEEKHFEECSATEREDHIFTSVRRLAEKLD